MKVIVSAQKLHTMLQAGSTHVFDVRWQLGKSDDVERFAQGHIKGATFVDLEKQLAQHGQPATEGRHPLPDIAEFAETLNFWGLSHDSTVAIYDDNKNLSAARLWWLLRHVGIAKVYLLDGGIQAWIAAGYPTVKGLKEASFAATSETWTFGTMPIALPAESSQLIDSRAADRFAGTPNPADKRPGHIPGAINIPTAGNVDEAGLFLDTSALKERFIDVKPNATVYCGSGVTACHNIAAMEMAGISAALYPGSYSAWEADEDNSVE